MLRNKIERLESGGEKNKNSWIPGHCGDEINEKANLEAEQSIKEGRDSQILLPVADLKVQWIKESKEELHSFCLTLKGVEEKATSKGTRGMARVCGSTKSNCLRVN
jgi:hypothetical protein